MKKTSIFFSLLLICLSVCSQQNYKKPPVRYDSSQKEECRNMRGNFRLVYFSGEAVNDTVYDYIHPVAPNLVRLGKDGEHLFTDSLGNPLGKNSYSKIRYQYGYNKDIILVEKDKKYGALSADLKKQILPCEYDYIKFFNKNRFELSQNGLYGLADLDGNVILPCMYDNIHDLYLKDKLYHVIKDTVDSFVNDKNETIAVFEGRLRTYHFSDTAIVVSFRFKDGLIDYTGKWLLPPKYSSIWRHGPFTYVSSKGLYNSRWEPILPPTYDVTTRNNNKYALIAKGRRPYPSSIQFPSVDRNEYSEYKYIDSLGNVLISSPKLIFESGSKLYVHMPEGYKVYDMDGNLTDSVPNASLPASYWEYYSEKDGEKAGFTDWWGQIKIPAQFDYIADSKFQNGYARVGNKNLFGKPQSGIIDTMGNVVIPLKYDELDITRIPNRFILQKGNNIFFTDPSGKEVKRTMNYIQQVRYPYTDIIFEKKGKYGIYDVYGNELQPLIYDKIESPYSKTKWHDAPPSWGVFISHNNKIGIWDVENRKQTVPVIYDDFGRYGDDTRLMFKQNDKWGFINSKTGEIPIPAIYTEINKISYSKFSPFFSMPYNLNNPWKDTPVLKVRKDSLWGTLNYQTGEEVIPLVYDEIEAIANTDFLKVRKDSLWGVIHYPTGKEIIPCRYDLIDRLYNDIFIVGENVWCN